MISGGVYLRYTLANGTRKGDYSMASEKRLYRSVTDKQIAGVCGGLAKYFDLDPTLVRLIFIAISLAGGPGLILYILLAIVIPEEEIDYTTPVKRKRDENGSDDSEDVV
jgi:phage shock protein C